MLVFFSNIFVILCRLYLKFLCFSSLEMQQICFVVLNIMWMMAKVEVNFTIRFAQVLLIFPCYNFFNTTVCIGMRKNKVFFLFFCQLKSKGKVGWKFNAGKENLNWRRFKKRIPFVSRLEFEIDLSYRYISEFKPHPCFSRKY